MKKLLFILTFIVCSCSSDDNINNTPKCYDITLKGLDERGHYIVVRIKTNVFKRYQVNDYIDYVGEEKICEPINLIEQEL
jgi:hypothetical protein